MKKIILFIAIFFIFKKAFNQTYTPINVYGQKHLRIKLDSAFCLPSDTGLNTFLGSLASKNNKLFFKKTNKWDEVLTGVYLDSNRIAFRDKSNTFTAASNNVFDGFVTFRNQGIFQKNALIALGSNNQGGFYANYMQGSSTDIIRLNFPITDDDTVAYRTWVRNQIASSGSNLTFTYPLSKSGTAVSIPAASISSDGYLTSTDWNNFDSKVEGVAFTPQSGGDVTGSASVSGLKTLPINPTLTIGNLKVTTAKIANLAVTDGKINDVAWSKVTSKPTTVAGYGITDALPLSGGILTNRLTGTSLILNKDSVPIVTGRLWGMVLDTSNNRVSRQLLPTYTAGRGTTLTGNAFNLDTTRNYTWTGSNTFNNATTTYNTTADRNLLITKSGSTSGQQYNVVAFNNNISSGQTMGLVGGATSDPTFYMMNTNNLEFRPAGITAANQSYQMTSTEFAANNKNIVTYGGSIRVSDNLDNWNAYFGNLTGYHLRLGKSDANFGNVIQAFNNNTATNTLLMLQRDGGNVSVGTTNSTDRLNVNGNINLTTAGNKIKIATGTNASIGVATLSGGTVTVNTTAVTSSSIIFLTVQETGTNNGRIRVSAKVANTSFTISSSDSGDNCVVAYQIIN